MCNQTQCTAVVGCRLSFRTQRVRTDDDVVTRGFCVLKAIVLCRIFYNGGLFIRFRGSFFVGMASYGVVYWYVCATVFVMQIAI